MSDTRNQSVSRRHGARWHQCGVGIGCRRSRQPRPERQACPYVSQRPRQVARRERRREGQKHEDDEPRGTELRDHETTVRRAKVTPIDKCCIRRFASIFLDFSFGGRSRQSAMWRRICRMDWCRRRFCRFGGPSPVKGFVDLTFGRQRIRYHPAMITPANAIPVTTGRGDTRGSSNAPVRKHAPKKNCHFIGGIGPSPFRFGGVDAGTSWRARAQWVLAFGSERPSSGVPDENRLGVPGKKSRPGRL